MVFISLAESSQEEHIIKVAEFIKKNKAIIIKACVLGLLPLFLCVLYCTFHAKTIFDVYLPGSEWNDELFYFKQVEAIVKYGFPQGYFGFNESHAQVLSFAAWSPVLVFPWIIWGKLFGWGLMSPILCNIFLLTLAVVLFVLLVKPNLKQSIMLGVGICSFYPFIRYMLSGMPEVICFSMAIIFYGLVYSYNGIPKKWKLVVLFVMASVMTLMRPYLILFLLIPVYFCVKDYKVKGIIISVVVAGVTAAGYALIKKFLGAEYFADLFFTDWITTFIHEGFGAGVRNLVTKLYYMGSDFKRHTILGIKEGLCSGAIFASYLVVMCIMAVQAIIDVIGYFRNKEAKEEIKKTLLIEVHFVVSLVSMLFALLLMYKLTEGSKHLLLFLTLSVFVVSVLRTKVYEKLVILCATFIFFFIIKGTDPYDYAVPFKDIHTVEMVGRWQGVYNENLVLSEADVPSFDNVVIWTFCDEIDGVNTNSAWQYLYKLPEGFGISCCMPAYVKDNMDDLKSKYIMTPSGGTIDISMEEKGYTLIFRDEELALYMTR